MCREFIVAYNTKTDKIITGVGHHHEMFEENGISDQNDWVIAQSNISKGPGEYFIETHGKISGKAVDKISAFFKDLHSNPDNIIKHIRKHGWDPVFVSLLTGNAQSMYDKLSGTLRTAYDRASQPIIVNISTENTEGTITYCPDTEDLYDIVVNKPLVEIFAILFSDGMNRINSWKKLK